jgi:PIN domain nuclease of toxin-antitoxin system
MQLLLDTHALLWFVGGDSRLVEIARSLIADEANEIYVSVASVWEMAIKHRLGKLQLGESIDAFLARELRKYDVLPISVAHAVKTAALDLHHRDPFDRLLAAQSLSEDLPLVSADPVFDGYGVRRIWNVAP